jgi:hypothetical protein
MRLSPTIAACIGLFVAACQQSAPWTDPAVGTDTCDSCSAVIAAPRFAAQLQRADGSIVSFDDPACLLRALAASADPPRAVRFHTERDDGWVESGEVWFARVPGQTTPRGDGWLAFSSFASAQDVVAAAGGGEILPYDQLRQRLAR